MWNERYAAADYVYGTEPNTFLLEHAETLSGPVLSLCEGEGRNAVFPPPWAWKCSAWMVPRSASPRRRNSPPPAA